MMTTQHNGLHLQVPVTSDRAGKPLKKKGRKANAGDEVVFPMDMHTQILSEL
jgi:hypothetical protein